MSMKPLPKLPPIKPWPSFKETPLQKECGKRRILLTLLATLLFHWVIVFEVPWPSLVSNKKASKDIKLQIVHKQNRPRFVEANPNAPSNDPDKTPNVAARAQQSAQPDAVVVDTQNLPNVDGEVENSQAIIAGDMAETMPFVPMARGQSGEGDFARPMPEGAREKESLKVDPSELTGKGIYPVAQENPHLPEDNSMIVMASSKQMQNDSQEQAEAMGERLLPRPRQKVSVRVVPAPLMKSSSRATQVGVVAIDAKMTPFGLYRQQMMEAISQQWYLLASHLKFLQTDTNAQVVLEVIVDKEGSVEDLKVIHSSASTAATLVCQDAIMSRSPFGEWDPSMVDLFGDRQTIRIHFYYR